MNLRKPPLYAVLAVLVGLGLYRAVDAQIETTWSTTANSNTAASPYGAAEGIAPSVVNNIMRQMMAETRRFAEQLVLGSFGPDGGSANAIFVTPAIAPSAQFVSGARFRIIPANSTTASAPTVKIGTVGPLTIAKISNQTLHSGDILANVPADLIYHGGLGGMVLLNPQTTNVSASAIPSGTVKTAGKETIWIPAGAIIARTTSGATISTAELSTNKVMLKALAYEGSTQQEFGQFQIGMPKSWNLGTLTSRFYWTALSGSGTVQWYVQCTVFRDNDALDTAFGTARGVTDTFLSSNNVHISDETAAITPAGTAAEGGLLACQVYRDGPTDTHAADAFLLGLRLFYTSNATNDN